MSIKTYNIRLNGETFSCSSPILILCKELLLHLFHVVLRVLANSKIQEKETKNKENKEKVKFSLLIDDIFIYVESPMEYIMYTLNVESKFGKVPNLCKYLKGNIF